MILNLKDVIRFMEKQALDVPLIRDGFLILSPGLTDDEYNRLIEAFPTLPESYLNFIKLYDVKQIELGGCQISVCVVRKAETLLKK